jgi:hypothetical protein
VDACDRNGAGGFINRSIPSPSGVRALRAQQPKGRMYLVGRVGTLKPLAREVGQRHAGTARGGGAL